MSGNDSSTNLLLHCDGADGGTTFTDSSFGAKTVTRNGSAVLDDAQKKFGTTSGLFTGAANGADYLSLADASDWDIGGGAFTIDWQLRWNGVGADATDGYILVSQRGGAGNEAYQLAHFNGDWRFAYTTDGTTFGTVLTWADVIATGAWNHYAFVRTGNTFKLFKDGSNIGDNTAAVTIFNSTATFKIGGDAGTSSSDSIDGWIDEFRMSNGIARWTANFTPPAAPYSNNTLTFTKRPARTFQKAY